MRLPALKVKKEKEEKNMCNLSRKEGSSLFAVLAKRQRKTLPKNLHLHAEQLISFWPLDMQFRKQPHQLNKKRVNGAKTEPCRWRWPRDCRSLLAVCLGDTAQGSECHVWNPTPEVNALCSMLYAPAVSLKFHWLDVAWRAFLSFKVKINSIHPFTSR